MRLASFTPKSTATPETLTPYEPMDSKTFLPCKACAAPVAILPDLVALAQNWGVLCPACLEEDDKFKRHGAARIFGRARFLTLCPPCFSDTIPARLPQPMRSVAALKWQYGLQGLVLFGLTATGKSRTVSLIIERELKLGRRVVAFGPGDFRRRLEEQKYTAGSFLKRLGAVDLLFFDDIEKNNLVTWMEKDLFSVLNARMGRLPTIFTSNLAGDELTLQFKLGEPMVRRIRQFCYCIHFGEKGLQSGAHKL